MYSRDSPKGTDRLKGNICTLLRCDGYILYLYHNQIPLHYPLQITEQKTERQGDMIVGVHPFQIQKIGETIGVLNRVTNRLPIVNNS